MNAATAHSADLLLDLRGVLRRLSEVIDRDVVDTFLYAAAAVQVLEDHRHRDLLWMQRATGFLRDTGWGAVPAAATGRAASIMFGADERNPAQRRIDPALIALRSVRDAAANALMRDVRFDCEVALTRLSRAVGIVAHEAPASVSTQVIRLPSSFRSFDQHPRDLHALAARLADRLPAAGAPVVVLGLRTSGSYLAPLLAAALSPRPGGVAVLTVRPGHPLHRGEVELLGAVGAEGGAVIVVDDPPSSGSSLVAAIREVEAAGVDPASIVPAFACFVDDDHVVIAPERLEPWRPVLLPFDDWDIHARLRPEQVSAAVSELTGSSLVLESVAAPVPQRREHLRTWYSVVGRPGRFVLAEGVGIGFLGTHAARVAEAVRPFSAEPIGVVDGVLFSWSAGPGVPTVPDIETVVSYVAARRERLAVDDDRSMRLTGRQAVWEVAANIVSASTGRLAPFVRKPAVDAAVRRLLEVSHPAVIDGRAADGWHVTDGALTKFELAEGAFSHRDLWSYDPVFDLAAFSATSSFDAAARLRTAWETTTGEQVSPERWMLLELVHLWDLRRQGQLDRATFRRHQARAVHTSFGRRLLPEGAQSGWSLAAIDLDGVLECTVAGHAAPTVSGVQALRTLARHGYRPVLCTGRSIDEVADRCRAYGLAGGVAEYGSAVYVAATDRVVELVDPDGLARLASLRERLLATGWRLDDGFRHCIRAWKVDGGLRGGTASENAEALVGVDGVVAVPGVGQTDFVAAGVDKGIGLERLRSELALGDELPQIAFAIGDTVADEPMLRLADVARAPANARPDLDQRIIRTHASYQLGVLEAVRQLVGHPDDSCPVCAAPDVPAAVQRLHEVLSTFEGGARRTPWRMVKSLAPVRSV